MVFNKYTKENRLFSGKVKIMFNSRFSLCEELRDKLCSYISSFIIFFQCFIFYIFMFLHKGLKGKTQGRKRRGNRKWALNPQKKKIK